MSGRARGLLPASLLFLSFSFLSSPLSPFFLLPSVAGRRHPLASRSRAREDDPARKKIPARRRSPPLPSIHSLPPPPSFLSTVVNLKRARFPGPACDGFSTASQHPPTPLQSSMAWRGTGAGGERKYTGGGSLRGYPCLSRNDACGRVERRPSITERDGRAIRSRLST